MAFRAIANSPSAIAIAAVLSGSLALVNAGLAAESGGGFSEAKVVGILDGKEVYVNKKRANLNEKAGRGGTLGTGGKSRARVLFDPNRKKDTIGLLKPNTRITIGSRCFNLEDGEIWVDGPQSGCAGSATVRVKGTSYVLARISEDTSRLSVMHGEAVLTRESEGDEPDIPAMDEQPRPAGRFPRFAPIFGVGASAFTSNSGGVSYGESSALVLGEVALYAPLWQHQISRLLYSYTSASSNFDGFWGVSSEVGYRWFSPARQSSQGFFIGYNGVEDPQCFHSQLALGAEYNPGRWFFGINGAIRADDCISSTSYAAVQVGVPIAQIGDRTARLSLAPFLVTGLGNDYLGGRVGVSIPLSDRLSLSAYGQYDRLFDTVIGGNISYRFGGGKHFINDPNRVPNPIPGASMARRTGTAPITIAASLEVPLASLPIAQTDSGQVIKAGEEVVFNNQGDVIDRQRMSQARFKQLVESNLKGQDLLPESLAVYATYKQLYGEATPRVMAVTGAQWAIEAADPYPRPRAGEILQIPEDRLPKQAVQQKPEQQESPTEDSGDDDIVDFFPESTP